MKIVAIKPLRIGSVRYGPGSLLEVDDAEAQKLFERKTAMPCASFPEEVPPVEEQTVEEQGTENAGKEEISLDLPKNLNRLTNVDLFKISQKLGMSFSMEDFKTREGRKECLDQISAAIEARTKASSNAE